MLRDDRVRQAFLDGGHVPPTQARVDRVGFTQAERKILNAATQRREALELAASARADDAGFSVAATQHRRGS